MIASFFNGAVISIEHLIMTVAGLTAATVLGNRISKLRIQVNGRITEMEERITELEAQDHPTKESPA